MARNVSFGRVAELVSSALKAQGSVSGDLSVSVLVADDAPAWLARAVRDSLLPEQEGAQVRVARLAVGTELAQADLALVCVGPAEAGEDEAVRAYASSGIPVCVVAESSLDAPGLELPEALAPYASLVAASEAPALLEKLADWLLDNASDPICAAANFPFCRDAEVARLTNRCALENAVVGAVDLVRGADLPIMASNQAKLALDVAAARGRTQDALTAAGLAGVVAAAFAYRGVARVACRGAGPLAFLVRAAVAYGGTALTGLVASELSEGGVGGLAESAAAAAREVVLRAAEAAGARTKAAEAGASGARRALPGREDGSDYVIYERGEK